MVDSGIAELNMCVTMLRGVVHIPLLNYCSIVLSHHKGGQQAENLNSTQMSASMIL